MSDKVYTKKQLELLKLWQQGKLKRINILDGAVRSGKTWISLVLWAFWIASAPKDKNYLMCAKTLTTLKRNCLFPLQELVGKANFSFSVPAKEAVLFGRHILLEGASDKRSEAKIRGLTLAGAYIDEVTTVDEDFFKMLLSRLSERGAKLFGTTNPDSPRHWLYLNFLQNDEIDLLHMRFLLSDNDFLDDEYKRNICKEYSGVFYERFILGRWVVAEGAIYKAFSEHKDDYLIEASNTPPPTYINVGVDFGGNKSQHAIVACGFDADREKVYVLKSRSIPATGTSVDDIRRAIAQFCDEIIKQYGFIDLVYCDSAEQAIINQLRQTLPYNICNSIKNKIIDRIRCEDMLITSRRLFIIKNQNEALIDGLETAVWSDKSADDERLDDGTSNIDILDAFEYAFEPHIITLTGGTNLDRAD